ncbi:MAG TPA: hypothetical protein VFF65_09405 [Phycisphaerales bacterium]|nr:hypothetical protein [Phycisphaerales bacterium]
MNLLALTDLTVVQFWCSLFAYASGLLCMWLFLRGQRRPCPRCSPRCRCGRWMVPDAGALVAPGGVRPWVCRRCGGGR